MPPTDSPPSQGPLASGRASSEEVRWRIVSTRINLRHAPDGNGSRPTRDLGPCSRSDDRRRPRCRPEEGRRPHFGRRRGVGAVAGHDDQPTAAATGTAEERARTLNALAGPATSPDELRRPRRVFPLSARGGGVLVRRSYRSRRRPASSNAALVNLMRQPGCNERVRAWGGVGVPVDFRMLADGEGRGRTQDALNHK
ncbi:3,4-dihydroxy-2-butanone-4-phosphate synthase [Pseudonocardia sp. NPDC049154]|uniref:3,4-dihydroxy-2-butanone-4-phosphate synthase n=1 Tax=Pseudonocardia sp. NPDC049154 TaxID=3155501 RepID=UPI0033D61970